MMVIVEKLVEWRLAGETEVSNKTCPSATLSNLKRLVAGFPPRRPGFKPGSSHVGFVADKVALGQVLSEYILGYAYRGLRETTSIIFISAKIRTGHLLSTSQKRYCLRQIVLWGSPVFLIATVNSKMRVVYNLTRNQLAWQKILLVSVCNIFVVTS
jgi:hypothetical protein